MAQDSGTQCDDGTTVALEDTFEPTATALVDLWMRIADCRLSLSSSVQELRQLSNTSNSHTQHTDQHSRTTEMEMQLEHMDALIFESMEKADDLFTLVRQDLANRKKQSAPSTVDALDAYLGGAIERLERPMRLSRSTQTDNNEELMATSSSPPAPLAVRRDMPSIELFDLLSKKLRQRPQLQIKTEFAPMDNPVGSSWTGSAASQSSGKRRRRSPFRSPDAAAATSDSDDSKARSFKSDPTKKARRINRPSLSLIKGRHPQRVLGHRTHDGLREYAVKYDGVGHVAWLSLANASKAAGKLITAYNAARKNKNTKPTSSSSVVPSSTSTTSSSSHSATASGVPVATKPTGASASEPLYIVDKIVDHRIRNGKKEYLVKWDGYGSDENTWESASKLRGEVREIVDRYENKLSKRASREHARERELMRTKSAMQAMVDTLSGKTSTGSSTTSSSSTTTTSAAQPRVPVQPVAAKGVRLGGYGKGNRYLVDSDDNENDDDDDGDDVDDDEDDDEDSSCASDDDRYAARAMLWHK